MRQHASHNKKRDNGPVTAAPPSPYVFRYLLLTQICRKCTHPMFIQSTINHPGNIGRNRMVTAIQPSPFSLRRGLFVWFLISAKFVASTYFFALKLTSTSVWKIALFPDRCTGQFPHEKYVDAIYLAWNKTTTKKTSHQRKWGRLLCGNNTTGAYETSVVGCWVCQQSNCLVLSQMDKQRKAKRERQRRCGGGCTIVSLLWRGAW
jgi:hypothetical protein